MADKKALTILLAGMVLDRALFIGLGADEMSNVIGTIRSSPGKMLKVVPNADEFFTARTMISLIKAADKSYALIAENAQIVLSPANVAAIQMAEDTIAAIQKSMVPKYEFANVPAGWTIATDLSLGKTTIKRKRTNSNGDGMNYSLSPLQTEKLWGICSKKWAKLAGAPVSGTVNVNGGYGTRSISVSAEQVTVGCQTIRRYELEQLAKYRGWAFPQAD